MTPKGWKLVPTDATPEMLAAAWDAWKSRHGGKLGPGPAFAEAVRAAIQAAPARSIALPDMPDDDADFTPEVARKIIGKYRDLIATLSAPSIAASPPPPVEGADQMQALAGFLQRLEGLVAKNEAIFNAALAEYRARYRDEHSALSAIGAKDED